MGTQRSAVMWKFQIITSLAVIMVVLLVGTSLMVAAGPRSGLALEVDSGDCGLVVRAEKRDDTGNLNPGDTKNSHVLIAENTKITPFRYYFNIKKVSSIAGLFREMVGRPLDDILVLTVTRGDEELFSGILSRFEELDMGILRGYRSEEIHISVYFPTEAGNEYQGSSVTVVFQFRSACGNDNNGNGNENGNGNGGDNGNGNSQSAILVVQKFHDLDGDGIWDDDEEQIEGWPVFINGEEYITPVNLELEPGAYTVAEVVLEGWVATTQTEKVVKLQADDTKVLSFGNYQPENGFPPEEGENPPGIPDLPPHQPEQPPQMPATGETPPYYYYGVGAFLIIGGLLLGISPAGKNNK